MQIRLFVILLSLTGGIFSSGPAFASPPVDERESVPERPADAAEPRTQRSISLQFNSEAGETDKEVDQAVFAAAGEIAESANRSQRTKGGRLIELKEQVRLWLKDDSIQARAARAVIIVQNQKNSTTTIEKLTVTLSGNARWASDGVEVTADELTIVVRPRLQPDTSVPPAIDWIVRGKAKVVGKNFEGSADRVEVSSSSETAPPGRKSLRLLLDGAATMSQITESGERKSGVQAGRIEFFPNRNELKLDSAKIGGANRAKNR